MLFLIALRMIFPLPEYERPQAPEREPFIVPLAVPLVAGPWPLRSCCCSWRAALNTC